MPIMLHALLYYIVIRRLWLSMPPGLLEVGAAQEERVLVVHRLGAPAYCVGGRSLQGVVEGYREFGGIAKGLQRIAQGKEGIVGQR